MLKKYVTLYNRETGEERTMLDYHAAYMLRVCSDWTDTMPKAAEAEPVEPETVVESEQKSKRKKRGD